MKNMILFAGLVTSAATAFGAIRAVTPDMWGGKTNSWQLQRHAQKMSVITNGGSKVVFVGDSITHNWEGAGGAAWKNYFAGEPYKALNLGYGGDRTEHVLWRLTTGGELDGYEAKCVLLMIGTNNTGHFPFAEEPPLDTILGIREILKTIRAKQPKAKVVLMPIFTRGFDFTDGCRRRNEVVNKEICRFADGKTIFWCDFNEQFLTPEGILPREIFSDLLHPGPLGYEIWYAAVKPYIDYALSDGKLPAPANRYASCVRKERFRTNEPVTVYPSANVKDLNCWWLNRALEKRNQAIDAKGEIDLVFFGDSITHNWEKQGKETLAELEKTYSVLNLGVSGDRTEHLVWRGENGELDGYKAKCIMLMIGTNNTWHRRDNPELVATGIMRILEVIAKKQPQAKVLLLPIFPFGSSPTHPQRIANDKVNELIRPCADGEKVIWVDFNAKFLDEKGDNVKWMPDHCHPNAAGYREVWLPAVLPYFKSIVGK